ncbi:hypothetical protein V1508DRAFT_395037 [Lipomyces doorenjongii]|uniref:uncharacterized protein n=1 Tax=Lipomyces doorenjongii TaxID=383834 RepID=UPI0034CFE25F
MRQKYLERKANRAPSVPVTAARLVDDGYWIMQWHVPDDSFKHDVLIAGLLPLLQQQQQVSENFPQYQQMLRLVGGRVSSLSPPTNSTYVKSKNLQKETLSWLPMGIDSAELIHPDFSQDDWQDAVDDFVRFQVAPTDVSGIPTENQAFAMVDEEWVRGVLGANPIGLPAGCCGRAALGD